MGAAENKQLMQDIFAEMAKGKACKDGKCSMMKMDKCAKTSTHAGCADCCAGHGDHAEHHGK